MPSFDPRHEWEWFDDFFGAGTFVTSAGLDPWVITDTSSGGTPTYTRVDLGESTVSGALGSASLTLEATEEVQNVCLSFGDVLCFDIDKLRGFECRVKLGQASVDSATQVAFGLTGDRNDAIDSIAIATIFRVVGGDSTTAVVAENDDGTNTNDDVATGTTLINAWKTFRLEFPQGNASVIYKIDGARVASGTTFDMSAHHGGVQPFFQIQKSSDTNADSLQIDYVHLWGVR